MPELRDLRLETSPLRQASALPWPVGSFRMPAAEVMRFRPPRFLAVSGGL
jgi:hypothetical protein